MTTTAKRPTTARKHTRTTDTKREDALEQGIRITLDGDEHVVRLGDVTSNLARELRRGTGMALSQLMFEIANDPDLDSIASFIWLARRLSGEKVQIDDVIVTYTQVLGDGFEVDLPGKREDADSPEA